MVRRALVRHCSGSQKGLKPARTGGHDDIWTTWYHGHMNTLLRHPATLTLTLPLVVAEPIIVPRPGRPWTVADLQQFAGREERYELVRGDLLMMSPASPKQGRYAMRLGSALQQYVEAHDLGEVYTAEPGFQLQPEPDAVVRAPDVAFVQKERIPPPEDESGFWSLAPDLVVEIISPSETAVQVQAKVQDYLTAGSRLIWLVYPETHTVVEYRAGGAMRLYTSADTLDGADVVPGFQYPLAQLFRETRRM